MVSWKIEAEDIYTNEKAQNEFISALKEALTSPVPSYGEATLYKSPEEAKAAKDKLCIYWSDVAKKWDEVLA